MEEVSIAEVLGRIQAFVCPRRLRAREHFVDFDPLRSGRCTKSHFARAIDLIGVQLTEQEVAALSDHFSEAGTNVLEPQVVHYLKFCQQVDEVFASGSPTATPRSPGLLAASRSGKLTSGDEEAFSTLLVRVAALVKMRGIVLKLCWQNGVKSIANSPALSPALASPRRGGKVTKSQFVRAFPLAKELSQQDMDLLCERYSTDSGEINFMALHQDVTEINSYNAEAFPKSELIVRLDNTAWTHHSLSAVDKLRSKVVEKRVRVYEYFQDFDTLRKGCCSMGQVSTVFTILNLGKEFAAGDFDEIIAQYTAKDGLFCYTNFCRDVDQDFTYPLLEKEPLKRIKMPDASSTAPARRNKMAISEADSDKVAALEEKMRYRIRTRGILMKPAFQDMDKCNRGYVTRGQFSRVLDMLGFGLDANSVALLCSVYCDLGNHNDVNYVDFNKSVDPKPQGKELSLDQTLSPRSDSPSKYFDSRGRVGRMVSAAA
jgi:Ca2+-binding EF-hand superfamily protein